MSEMRRKADIARRKQLTQLRGWRPYALLDCDVGKQASARSPLRYRPERFSSSACRAATASSSNDAGSCTATPGGTASPASMALRRPGGLPRRTIFASATGGAGGAVLRAASAWSWVNCSSSSAMRRAAALAARFASRPFAFSAALAVSSFSICARNSPLLGGGTRVVAAAGTAPAAGFLRAAVTFEAACAATDRPTFVLAGGVAVGAGSAAADRRFARTGVLAAAVGFAGVVLVDRAILISSARRNTRANIAV